MNLLTTKYNPFKNQNENIILLTKIEQKLLKLIEEFANKESLTIEAKEELKSLVQKAIAERKSEYFFKDVMEGFSRKLHHTTCVLLNTDPTSENPYKNKDLFYLKNTRHTVTYE
jgi:DNA-binding protein H-NS